MVCILSLAAIAGCTERKSHNIIDYGAVSDGKTLNTKAIQKAIDQAISTSGTVIIPKGIFYTGSLTLGSNMTLKLETGAILKASDNMADYEGEYFIYAPQAHNLVIAGEGTIDGNGLSFFDGEFNYTQRPEPWIVIEDSKKVLVEGLSLINSPSHVLNFNFCDSVTVSNLTIRNDPRTPNTDGIDIRNSKNVTITNCDIRTGDDAICIKNARNADKLVSPTGKLRSAITESITVKDCYLESDDAALKLGTGSGNLTQNIHFKDITIRNSRYATALFMMDGGRYNNIHFERIDAVTGSRHDQEYPVFIDVHTRLENGLAGGISGVYFRDSKFTTRGITYISGHPKRDIDSVVFENVVFHYQNRRDNSEWRKPKGNKKVEHWATAGDYAATQADFVIAHTKNVLFENVRLVQDSVIDQNFELIDAVIDMSTVEIETQ